MKKYTIGISVTSEEIRMLLLGINYVRIYNSTLSFPRDFGTLIELEKKINRKKILLDDITRKGVIL